jgi:uncharacterized protein
VSRLTIGQRCELVVVARHPDGLELDDGAKGLLLPNAVAPEDATVGQSIDVFIYQDGEGRPQPTTLAPKAMVGEAAYLECVSVARPGAYLDWGVPKDLLVPRNEQEWPMRKGEHYVAAVCLDVNGERLIGSTKVTRHLDYEVEGIAVGDEVDVLVFGSIDAGVQVVVNRRYRGLVHRTNVYRDLPIGSKHQGFVASVREDNRLDIELDRRGAEGSQDAQEVLLAALKRNGGRLELHDRSSPADIKRLLGISKKAFKRAAGGLYKARTITLDDNGLTLVTSEE